MSERVDQKLVELGLAQSRERAKALIMEGVVLLDGVRVMKPGDPVREGQALTLKEDPIPFVSRGGFKLDKALKVFPVDPAGKVCIDCGASTGGFTDVLLQHGAARVYAVDVGYGQLAWKLRTDERVINLERTNLRYLSREQIPELMDLAVMDVSFISIRLILPVVKEFLKPGADYICLIKPQFEAGREEVGKKGVVRDPAVHEEVVRGIMEFASSIGFSVMGLDYSPIKGPEGNIEYICHLKNGTYPAPDLDPAAVVKASHEAL